MHLSPGSDTNVSLLWHVLGAVYLHHFWVASGVSGVVPNATVQWPELVLVGQSLGFRVEFWATLDCKPQTKLGFPGLCPSLVVTLP